MSARVVGSVDGTSLFACSLCGVPARYPLEMRYDAERNFVCFRHKDTTTKLQEARKHGQGVTKPDEQAPRFPIGGAAGWQIAIEGDDMTAGGRVNGTTATVTGAVGSMTAGRTTTGVYVVSIPAAISRTVLMGVAMANVSTPGPIPLITNIEPISATQVRVLIHNRVGTATDANFDIYLQAV